MDNIIFLDKDIFNNKYDIIGMSKNSIIIKDKSTDEVIMVHRRILNKVLSSETTIPCMRVEREFQGTKSIWLATFFSI